MHELTYHSLEHDKDAIRDLTYKNINTKTFPLSRISCDHEKIINNIIIPLKKAISFMQIY